MRWPWQDDTDRAWRQLGEQDPYYGVLTCDRFRHENLDDARRAEFFRSGELHVDKVLNRAAELFGSLPARGTALDFGCGVGRVAIPLARRFDRVYAVDISPAMLDEARKNAAAAGVDNIEFVQASEHGANYPRDVQFIHSYIVLQHIPARRGLRIISTLLSKLAPGGVAAIELALTRHQSPLRRAASSLKRHLVPLHWAHNIVRGRAWSEPLIQTNEYDLTAVSSLLLDAGIESFHVDLRRKAQDTPQDKGFLFIQKPQ